MDSTIWWYIALGIVILGLIIAGIGVVKFIKGMKEPLKKMKGSAGKLKERADKLLLEVSSLQHTASELTEEMAVKAEKVSLLVDAGKGTINSLVDLNASIRAITDKIAVHVERDSENVKQVNQFSTTADHIINLPKNLKTVKYGLASEERSE